MSLSALLLSTALLGVAPTWTPMQWATPMTVQLRVGEAKKIEVGAARGLRCDDLSIVRAELRDHTEANNLLVLTGLRPGATKCRVGIEKGMPSFFASILVTK